jgi:hypothetical protein
MSLPEFLLARIAEDEEAARAAIADDSGSDEGFSGQYEALRTPPSGIGIAQGGFGDAAARMIATFAVPARVLAECEAKRRIVEHWKSTVEWAEDPGCNSPDRYLMVAAGLYEAMRHLAEPSADHPDYQPEWRV